MKALAERVGKTQSRRVWLGLLGAVALGLALMARSQAAWAEPAPSGGESTIQARGEDVAIYRLYNHWDGAHLITKDAHERQQLIQQGWRDEGVAFKSPQEGAEVYRLYNRYNGDHFYTAGAAERDTLVGSGWENEGVGFYGAAMPSDYPVYRAFNPYMTAYGGRGNHLWTLDEGEYQKNVTLGWRGEGAQWFASGPGDPNDRLTLPYPVDQHGALSVQGTNLVDSSGAPFQLRGISTHGMAWFPQYVNKDAFQTLRDDWGANCVRLALYAHEYNGYATGGDQTWLKSLVRDGVNAARDLGMYAIVDWHVLNEQGPTVYEQQAREFFDAMSREFASYPNVLYEICNEPNGWANWETIKGYAERIIPVIRANDPDAVIIVGTPTWSQDVDQAAANRLGGETGKNVMYALHFYAGTHGQWLKDKITQALDSGLPIFISEFGTSTADGQSGFFAQETSEWLDLANSKNVSWINWSLCNKAEAASLIQPWCNKTSWWDPSELTDNGRWVRERLRAEAGLS